MASAFLSPDVAVFDAVAASYEAALGEGLRLSGEGPEYFAERRIEWTRRVIDGNGMRRVLDFGCGVGLASPRLSQAFQSDVIWGYDPSTAAIDRAKGEHRDGRYHFTADAADLPAGEVDLAYCNGVFHHIPPSDRAAALAIVSRTLRPGGWFALWENNPWNPGTRWIMSRIPFDRDAVTISPIAARRMLRDAGFQIVRTDAWFLFPRALRSLRPLETLVHRLPLGGQYLVLRASLRRRAGHEFSFANASAPWRPRTAVAFISAPPLASRKLIGASSAWRRPRPSRAPTGRSPKSTMNSATCLPPIPSPTAG